MLSGCAQLQVTDYLDVITDPIDLQMIEKRLNQPNIYYKTKVRATANMVCFGAVQAAVRASRIFLGPI